MANVRDTLLSAALVTWHQFLFTIQIRSFYFFHSEKGIFVQKLDVFSRLHFPSTHTKKPIIYGTSYLKKEADAVMNIFSNPVNTWP